MSARIPILKQAYLSKLRADVETERSVSLYKGDSAFPLDAEGLFMETPLRPCSAIPVLAASAGQSSQELAASDADNAIAIHRYLGGLTELQASDRRLWVYLTHAEFFNYCRLRFPFRSSTNDVNNVIDHWFFGKGKLRRNAISRLWWAAHLTYAPWKECEELRRFQKDDEYFYTRFILKNQDIYQGIIERDFGSSLVVRIVSLDVLAEAESQTSSLTQLATRFTKNLNLLASHTDMGAIDVDVLRGQLTRIVSRIV